MRASSSFFYSDFIVMQSVFCASRRCLVFASPFIDLHRCAFGFCWPGIRPGRRVTFIWRQMKVTKAKAPHRQRPLRCATGQPAVLGQGLRGRTRCRPMAFRSNSRRESEHEVWSLYGDQTQPMPCAPRRWQKGGGQPQSNGLLESCFLSRYLVIYASGARSARASSYQFHRNQHANHCQDGFSLL